ncbi:MAG: hypothetical protein FWH53_00250 [Leptospirales bacterium]|nr:hypothetical protein [Leptospirales bacterium]
MAQLKDLLKKLGIEIQGEIYDETGQPIPYDEERVQRAIFLVSKIQNNIIETAELIAEFFGDKLYLYLGISKEEAGTTFFGMSPTVINRFERIGKTFSGKYEYATLGVTRLDSLSLLPEDLKNELIESKEITLTDGTTLSLEEIAGMRVKKLEDRIRELRRENSKLSTRLAETDKMRDAEIKDFEEEINTLKKITNIPPDEIEFHKKITKRTEVQNKIKEATASMYDAFMKLYQIKPDENNYETFQAGLEAFITDTAKRLLALESEHGALLGVYKEGIQTLARVK